eukprot:791588-Prymnesium_polylepis.1
MVLQRVFCSLRGTRDHDEGSAHPLEGLATATERGVDGRWRGRGRHALITPPARGSIGDPTDGTGDCCMMYFTGCVPTDPRIPWYVPVGRMWPGVAWRHKYPWIQTQY